jgi:hypothetical protein
MVSPNETTHPLCGDHTCLCLRMTTKRSYRTTVLWYDPKSAEFFDQGMVLLQKDLALGPTSLLRTSNHRRVRNAEQSGGRLVRRPSVFDKHARIRNRIVTSTLVAVSLLVNRCSHVLQLASNHNNNPLTDLDHSSSDHGLPSACWHLCSGMLAWNEILRSVLTLANRFQPSSPKKVQLRSTPCRLPWISKHNRSTPCSSLKAASEAL